MRHIISTVAIGAAAAIGAAVAVALAAGAAPVVAAGVSAVAVGVPVGTQCATVPYTWAGTAALPPGESFSTGVVVPSEAGVQLAVAAYDVSTVDPAPGAVAIWIGGGAVANGVAVAGGEIAVTNGGSSDVILTRVELSLDRCSQVASAGPAPATGPVVEADPAAAPAPVAAPSTAAPALAAPSAVDLPATGRASGSVLLLAMMSTLLGGALVVATRRRTTALVHDR